MKKLFTLLIFVFLHGITFTQSPNLCGEKIIVELYKTTNDETNKHSKEVAEMLKSILINSDKCEYISTDKFGDLEHIIDRENRIQGRYTLNPTYSQSLIKRDITYITFVSSTEVYHNSLKSGSSKIVFYDTYTRNPDIEIEIFYTTDEIEQAKSIVRRRLDEKIQDKLDCDKIDEKVARLKKEVQTGEENLNRIIANQEYDCSELLDLMKEKDLISKIERRYNSVHKFLLTQQNNCEGLTEAMQFLNVKRAELKDANIEKERQEALKFREEARKQEIQDREEKLVEEQRKIDEQKRLDIGNETTLPCLYNLPYYEVSMANFRGRFNNEHFVQFAMLPLRYYDPCDLSVLYENRINKPSKFGPYIYLVNRGIEKDESVRLQGLIGPFQTIGEANSFLNFVQRRYDKEAVIYTP